MANRFWVGGTANWDTTAGTKWAATSGGAGGQAVPTISDNVFFDANSGANTITVTTNPFVLSMNFTGFTGTFAGSSDMFIHGSLTLVSAMTFAYTGNLNFSHTSGVAILTTAGKAIKASFTGIGGTTQLADDLTFLATLGLNLTGGTFNANGKNVTGSSLSSAGSNVREINMGSGVWTLTGQNSMSISGTNLTLNADTSTLIIQGNLTADRTFNFGSKTYNNVWFSNASSFYRTITGSNTFNDFKLSPGLKIRFTAGTTQTVTTFTAVGTPGNLIIIDSDTTGTHTLSKANGIVNSDYLNIQHSIATGGAIWVAGGNSINNQNIAIAGSGWIWWSNQTKNPSSFSNQSKNVSTFTTLIKNTSAWTNLTKT